MRLEDGASDIGRPKMRLDAVAEMMPAIALYTSLVLKGILPFRHNSIVTAVCLEPRLEK
jgi:hypothetical protein